MDSFNEKIIGMQTIKEAFMNAAGVFLGILIFFYLKLIFLNYFNVFK